MGSIRDWGELCESIWVRRWAYHWLHYWYVSVTFHRFQQNPGAQERGGASAASLRNYGLTRLALPLVAVLLEALPILVLRHLLAPLLDKRTH